MFACKGKDECSVSPWGALRRSFERRRFRSDDRGSCSKHPDSEVDCVSGVCVVPSDRSCSPALFADAGSDEFSDRDPVWSIPDAQPPPEERLFVFPESRAREWGGELAADGYWTPSFETVKEIDSRLPAALAADGCDPRGAAIAPRLAAYRGQFVGLVRGGKRRILGNYVCTRWIESMEADHPDQGRLHLDTNWEDGIYDGGGCFFHFWYDPRDKSFHSLSINGEG
jgi:hypothetical protein